MSGRRKQEDLFVGGEDMRRCTKCSEVKPLDRFPKAKGYAGGRMSTCKKCRYNRFHELYPDYFRTEEYRQKARIRSRVARERYPEKFRARYLAKTHVPLKPSCEQCGGTDQLHRHHPDYSKTLEVVTLCVRCHHKLHYGAVV